MSYDLPMKSASENAVLDRFLYATSVKTYAALAEVLGVRPQSISDAKAKGKIPPAWAVTIAEKYGVTVDWLLLGRGSMRVLPESRHTIPVSGDGWEAPIFVSSPSTDDPWKNVKWQEAPVIGLANCGSNDWYAPGPMALRVSLPVDYPYTPDFFAVLAVGTSMQPEGIKQGYVLFCDPSAGVEAGDAVYVEKANGTAAIKKFLKWDTGRLYLQGWGAPKQDGTQAPYFEDLDESDVKRVACVVVVKRKG